MLEGLPPNNAAHVMRLSCDEPMARQVSDVIIETFDPADVAVSAFEEAPTTNDWKSGAWIVEAYFGLPPDEANIRALIAAVAGEETAERLSFGRVETRDWVASSLEGLKPVRAGRFVVHGAHSRADVRDNDIAIEVEAALAFGTGHHGTTRGCLLMLDRIARRRRPRSILDIGTGTGVLAIAAAKLFKRPIHSGDIDPVSVAAAASNARRNGVGAFIDPVQARGAAHNALRKAAPYDLVFANILARPLRELAPDIAQLTQMGSDIVLSGLIARDVPGVLAAYRAQKMVLARRLDIDGWATLLMQKR
ncbi:50S ribosomal protein L11 methyltransferase [Methylocella tundrae]|uniref:Ribosomal protein L11 methyltransferase n=1 Tax=Methylocella tundrae TaxID=227605 RepID=A0A4U8Z0V3_METTU|nr:50S ribosomal protein L11 methyltransferase [Methylocella tundrae]WPP06234.1 50S ribosomal protein L11 methyltransferase [Methylocella tundrae]VFU08902.1 Ribosomal protein L11 methyltransferase [Methylocella tundrae]